MTSYYPVHYKNQDSIIRVKVEEHVNFFYQFVKYSDIQHRGFILSHLDQSSKEIVMFTSQFISGPPTNFPNYGDFLKTFVMKTYNFNVSTSPWLKQPGSPNGIYNQIDEPECDESYDQIDESENEVSNANFHPGYLNLKFDRNVYPIRVSIYEVHNPGHIIQILAKKYNNRWYSLWSGLPQTVPSTSRIFSPPLQTCNFKTSMLRLRFKNSIWEYKTKLDAVMLIGTTELIDPKNIKQSLTDLSKNIDCNYPCYWDIHNLTLDSESAQSDISNFQKNFSKYCTICKRNSVDDKGHNYLVTDHLSCEKLKKIQTTKDPSDEFKEQQCCSFSSLPDDVILLILEILDLRSMCRMSRVNKCLNNLARHPSLFKRLNLRYLLDTTLIAEIIFYFTSRCKYLQQLDLTSTIISDWHFKKLLNIGGNHLTHLRLRNWQSNVNDSVLSEISTSCKNLKVLDLSYVSDMNQRFSYLESLEFLEELNFEHAYIGSRTLCKILQKNHRMRDLNLNGVKFFDSKISLDDVMIQLRDSCPDLEIIGLAHGTITPRGIDALAECRNLRELNILFSEIYDEHYEQNLCKLFSSCQGLEKIYLSGVAVSKRFRCDFIDVHEVLLCKNLKQIFLQYIFDVRPVELLMTHCSKLKTIYVQYSNFEKFHIAQ